MESNNEDHEVKRQEPIFLFTATFRIKSAGGLHEEISQTIGISPTECHIRGEKMEPESESRNPGTWDDDLWAITSPLSKEIGLSGHLRWLWGILSPHEDYLERLVGEGLEMSISCVYRSDSETAGFSLEADALAVACELNVPLEVSVVIDDISVHEPGD